MPGDADQIGQDEIEALLRNAQDAGNGPVPAGASSPAARAASASAASATAASPSTSDPGVSQDDIELLLRKAEQALASIDEPANQLPSGVHDRALGDDATGVDGHPPRVAHLQIAGGVAHARGQRAVDGAGHAGVERVRAVGAIGRGEVAFEIERTASGDLQVTNGAVSDGLDLVVVHTVDRVHALGHLEDVGEVLLGEDGALFDAVHHDDVVRAKQLHLRENFLLGAIADRKHRDHRRDAEQNSERRKSRAKLVVNDCLGSRLTAESDVRHHCTGARCRRRARCYESSHDQLFDFAGAGAAGVGSFFASGLAGSVTSVPK